MSNYTLSLSDFKNRMSEEDYEFLNNLDKQLGMIWLSFVGPAGVGKSSLIQTLSQTNDFTASKFANNIYLQYRNTIYIRIREFQDNKTIYHGDRVINMWYPRRTNQTEHSTQSDSFMVNGTC